MTSLRCAAGRDAVVMVLLLLIAPAAGRAQPTVTRPAKNEPTAVELRRLWERAGGADYPTAYEAMYRLALLGDAACEMLREKVEPLREPLSKTDKARVARLIADLDADQYKVRSQATEELSLLGAWALPYLHEASGATSSAEARIRLTELIANLTDPAKGSPQRRQLARAMRVLRWADTSSAAELLKDHSLLACQSHGRRDRRDGLGPGRRRPPGGPSLRVRAPPLPAGRDRAVGPGRAERRRQDGDRLAPARAAVRQLGQLQQASHATDPGRRRNAHRPLRSPVLGHRPGEGSRPADGRPGAGDHHRPRAPTDPVA